MESLSSNEEFQLFGVIYTLRNSIRRSILEAFAEKETLTGKEIYQYLKKKGLVKTKKGHSPKKIRDYHFPPLIETGMLKELKDNLFEITSFGKDISKSINKFEEFRKLSPLRHRGLHREFILLELRKAKKTFGELKSKLDSLQLRQIIKRLKDSGFLKVIHPYDLLQITSLSYFIISPYYWFIKAVKDFIEKTKRSWFTEYSIITHLAIFWKEKFGRHLDLDETRRLIERGIEAGDIVKINGSYQLSAELSFENLSPSQRELLSLIKKGKRFDTRAAREKGFKESSVYKFLKQLEEKRLIERQREYPMIELTEKGKQIADCLFEIKEIVDRYFPQRVEMEIINC